MMDSKELRRQFQEKALGNIDEDLIKWINDRDDDELNLCILHCRAQKGTETPVDFIPEPERWRLFLNNEIQRRHQEKSRSTAWRTAIAAAIISSLLTSFFTAWATSAFAGKTKEIREGASAFAGSLTGRRKCGN